MRSAERRRSRARVPAVEGRGFREAPVTRTGRGRRVADVLMRGVRDPLSLGLEDEPLDRVGDREVQGQRRRTQTGQRALAVNQVVDHDVREIQRLADHTFITCNPEQEEATWLAGLPPAPRPSCSARRTSASAPKPSPPNTRSASTWPDSGSTPAECCSKAAAHARTRTPDRALECPEGVTTRGRREGRFSPWWGRSAAAWRACLVPAPAELSVVRIASGFTRL